MLVFQNMNYSVCSFTLSPLREPSLGSLVNNSSLMRCCVLYYTRLAWNFQVCHNRWNLTVVVMFTSVKYVNEALVSDPFRRKCVAN